jgi:hypothetical protein
LMNLKQLKLGRSLTPVWCRSLDLPTFRCWPVPECHQRIVRAREAF